MLLIYINLKKILNMLCKNVTNIHKILKNLKYVTDIQHFTWMTNAPFDIPGVLTVSEDSLQLSKDDMVRKSYIILGTSPLSAATLKWILRFWIL